jgi:hypothetical protein
MSLSFHLMLRRMAFAERRDHRADGEGVEIGAESIHRARAPREFRQSIVQ